ncbi:MAG: 4Fe-4S dicluster domain-containing protein [Dehalococcoidia bacterium]|nr:4Fe-4S dicluster domain-containing protein [Dehalococcoidia bacterium]
MLNSFVDCNPEVCTGCQLCELACAAVKERRIDLELTRIHLVRPNATLMMSVTCRLCEHAPCVTACPRQALSAHPENGTIILDRVRCTGCGWCIEACDFGAIAMDRRTKTVVICDLCAELGTGPRCVEACPKHALELTTTEGVAQRQRDRAVRLLSGSEG